MRRDHPMRPRNAGGHVLLCSAVWLALPWLHACSAGMPVSVVSPAMSASQSSSGTMSPPETAFEMISMPTLPPNDDATARRVAAVAGLALVDHHGLSSIRVRSAHSDAVVSLFGGQLLSFTPQGTEDVLWLSPDTLLPPQPTRGGAPVIWPYFSRQGQSDELPAHGLVRTLQWTLTDASRDAGGNLDLVLTPATLDGLPLQLRMELHIGRTLQQRLVTTNVSSHTVVFTEALHNYLRVGDVSRVRVEGVDGAVYRNKGEPYTTARAQTGGLSLAPFSNAGIDRIYRDTGASYQLLDPALQRRITLRTRGSNSLVIWNPGRAAETRSKDIGPGWRHYLCLETANVGQDVMTLAPGAQHVMSQQIAVDPL